MTAKGITRYAPSPTGYLHLGHILNAAYVWASAEKLGLSVILRIEDHDLTRSSPEFETAIYEDLDWLEFIPSNLSKIAGVKPSAFRQRDNSNIYRATLEALAKQNLIYGCRCSRKDIRLNHPQPTGDEIYYPGTCRNLGIPWDSAHVAVRLIVPDVEIKFNDLIVGPEAQRPQDISGDFVLRDRHGLYTYQLAVVVDDIRHGVTHVVRGVDLLSSTARQIVLWQYLTDKAVPLYAHHPLIYGDSGEKLSKRYFSSTVRDMRSQGISQDILIGRALFQGKITKQEFAVRRQEISQYIKLPY